MATMSPNFTEDRRHVPERRTGSYAAGLHSTSARSTTGIDTGTSTHMNALDWVAWALMLIGGLNWGLVGLFNVDLVATLFGEMSALSRVVYIAVGLSALYSLYTASKMARHH